MKPDVITVSMFLDGKRSQMGYKFLISKNHTSWKAFRTDDGFRRFMKNYGFRFDRQHTKIYDLRDVGKGRAIAARFFDKEVDEVYFWEINVVPDGAKEIFQVVNGNYVRCYIMATDNAVTIWRPNPNSEYYQPLDYRAMDTLYG